MTDMPPDGMPFDEAIKILLKQAAENGITPENTPAEVRDLSRKAKARHDGDCTFYGRTMVCTCGLLHRLIRKSSGQDYEEHIPAITMHTVNLGRLESILCEEERIEDSKA